MPNFGSLGRGFGRLGSESTPTSGYLNLGADYLPHYAAKVAQVIAGTSRCRVMCLGQSNTSGTGAGTGPNLTIGGNAFAWPKKLADALTAVGIPAIHNGMRAGSMGTGGTDAYVTLGSGWANNGLNSIAGAAYKNTSTTNSLSFAPVGAFDSLKPWYVRAPGFDTFTYNVDGGSTLATVNANGANAMLSSTATVALGTHTVNLQRTGVGADCDIPLIETWNSASPAVEFYNAGWSGANWGTIGTASQVWSSLNFLGTFAPDLTILADGSNDQADGTSESTFKANVQTIIDKAKLSGDVILISSTPYDESGITGGQAQRYVQAGWFRDLARTNSATLVDLSQLMGTYTYANGRGWIGPGPSGGNALHPSAPGYATEASLALPAVRV